jgi:enediyne biosynthesis protein E4
VKCRLAISGCLLMLVVGQAGCRDTAAGKLEPQGPFLEVASAAGLRFQHVHGGTSPFTILETTGSGCAFIDYDGDGWPDILLLSNLPTPDIGSSLALYRNNRDGSFTDVTREAGLGEARGFAMGCAVGDYDGDGHLDLYITCHGSNSLYRNNGDGTFTETTARAGVAAGGWSTSAAFADFDGDGYLDLYVVRYLEFDDNSPRHCQVQGLPMACAPITYPGVSDILYRNNGDGTFRDMTREAGVHNPDGRGLGVVWGDYDNDGRPDLFVANDAGRNYLYRNLGDGRFEDVALLQGVAYGEHGESEGCMGVAFGDYDNDGRLDLFVTNFQNETNALYRNLGATGFAYASMAAGVGSPSVRMLGFGTGFLDFDNDGQLDLFVANGHVQDTIARLDPESAFPQPRQLYRNLGGGRFEEAGERSGAAFTRPYVGRGAAFADFDNDGGLDVLVSNSGGPPLLLRNTAGPRGNWLRVRLVGDPPNHHGVGARVTVETGERRQLREMFSGTSYASASELRLHFGLGEAASVDLLQVRWPSGKATELRGVPANEEITIRETDAGSGAN